MAAQNVSVICKYFHRLFYILITVLLFIMCYGSLIKYFIILLYISISEIDFFNTNSFLPTMIPWSHQFRRTDRQYKPDITQCLSPTCSRV